MKKRAAWRKWALLPLFALIAAALLGFLADYTHTDREVLYLTPMFQDVRGWEIYTLTDGDRTDLTPQELIEVEPDRTFYLSRVLTEDLEVDGYTFLILDSYRPCSVFLDGALLYTTCLGTAAHIGEVTFPTGYDGVTGRAESVRCSLPSGFAGKTLTIATAHLGSEYGPSLPGIQLSSTAVEAGEWMSTANHSAMPAAAFTVAALLLLALLFYSLLQGGRDWPLLLLTAASLAQLFYYLLEYDFSSPAPTTLDTPWAAFLPYLMVLLPELFLAAQMKRWRTPCAILILASGGLSLIAPVANLLGRPLSFGYTLCSDALAVSLLALLACAALEARDKNRVFRLFWMGLGVVCAGVLAVCLASLARNGFYAGYVAALGRQLLRNDLTLSLYWGGTTLFVLASALSVYALIRRAADTQTALAVQSEQANRLDFELAAQKQYYEAKLTGEEELRAIRHDMKGHLATLSALLMDGKTQEAVEYLTPLTEQLQDRGSEVFCSDPYMNAVLGTFAPRFREHKIPFVCRIKVDGWKLPGTEVCLILNNALENALEASLQMPEGDRSVKVQSAVLENHLLFRISNRFDGTVQEQNGLPVSTKPEPGHGYGLANIRTAVKRLGGWLEYRVEDGFFVLDVRLSLLQCRPEGGTDHAV